MCVQFLEFQKLMHEIRVLNKKETMLASQKQDAMKAAFKDWIFKDQSICLSLRDNRTV